MFFSVFAAACIGAALTAVGFPLIKHVAGADTANIDVLKVVFTAVAGIGGAVALVVAYRRQKDLEQGRFIERYGAAAAQLGNIDPAVRIAGVYAMGGVADECTTFSRRQQCIDVLCGYLRQPYDPIYGSSHHTEFLATTKRLPSPSAPQLLEFHDTQRRILRQNDREVRKTIVRVITDHLHESANSSWTRHDFDFSTAVFENADFLGVRFSGERVSFVEASFTGRYTRFTNAKFMSNSVWFDRAMFTSDIVSFDNTTFAGKVTEFGEALFASKEVQFNDARFLGKSGSMTNFIGAIFSGDEVLFDGAVFDNDQTVFGRAKFSARIVSFFRATFSSDSTIFSEADFGVPDSSSEVIVSFNSVAFSSEQTLFMNCGFNAAHISFERPRVWLNVRFDWEYEIGQAPEGIHPRKWRPETSDVYSPIMTWVHPQTMSRDHDVNIHLYTLHIVNESPRSIYDLNVHIELPRSEDFNSRQKRRFQPRSTSFDEDNSKDAARSISELQTIDWTSLDGGPTEVIVPKDERRKSFSSPIPAQCFDIIVTFHDGDGKSWKKIVGSQDVSMSEPPPFD